MTTSSIISAELDRGRRQRLAARWQARRFLARRYPLGAVGALIIVVFVLTALFAGWITAYDPTSTNAARLARAAERGATGSAPTSWGATCWSRIVYGARISLAVGIGSTVLGCLIGVLDRACCRAISAAGSI